MVQLHHLGVDDWHYLSFVESSGFHLIVYGGISSSSALGIGGVTVSTLKLSTALDVLFTVLAPAEMFADISGYQQASQ